MMIHYGHPEERINPWEIWEVGSLLPHNLQLRQIQANHFQGDWIWQFQSVSYLRYPVNWIVHNLMTLDNYQEAM